MHARDADYRYCLGCESQASWVCSGLGTKRSFHDSGVGSSLCGALVGFGCAPWSSGVWS